MSNPNEKIIQKLNEIIAGENFSGAFLFSGPADTGKKEAALELIQRINNPEISVDKIEQNFHPDVIFIAPEIEEKKGRTRVKEISIEQVKPEMKKADFYNYQAFKKFFVIERADKMTVGAANSLLKIIEEPPKDCIFLLLTSFEDRLLDTIRSRCGKVAFPLLADEKIKKWLEENYSILSEEEIRKIVFASTGRYKLAQKLAQDKEALQKRNQEVENFRIAIKGGLNKAFDLSSDYSKDKEKLLEALDDWIYYLHSFTKENFFKNSDLRIQKKVFEMTRELIEVKISIETTNANPRLMLENYFVKFS
ncbi:MAG: hypothetical protein ACOCUF_01305 [Patescibacteria group bacterium]